MLASFRRYNFNIFEFTQQVGRNQQMPMIAYGLLMNHNIQNLVDDQKFMNFIMAIYNRYSRDVAYHNDLHGSEVALQVSYILNQRGMNAVGFSDYDQLALIVAALSHDVGHDGFTNAFHVNSKSNRYRTYFDVPVQEGYHAATTVMLLEQKNLDFLDPSLTRNARRLMKKRILCSILDTDMASSKNLFIELQ